MRNSFRLSLILSLSLLPIVSAIAQTLPVGTSVAEESLRDAQLEGKGDSACSYTIRPLYPFNKDSGYVAMGYAPKSLYSSAKRTAEIKLLPLIWQNRYNLNAPYGWNDGSMIAASGFQTKISSGMLFRYGPLHVQLQPEFLFAENKKFEGFSAGGSEAKLGEWYAGSFNRVDLPERFGNKPYSRILWGQSSLSLHWKALSLGISTENLYWGPGVRNSLLMSNNAPGFAHLSLNTIRPVHTAVGSFEAQLVAGRLESSGFSPLTPANPALEAVRPDDWRYFNGFAISYQPKWVHGLFLGMNRSFQIYRSDMGKGISDYIPVLTPFQKNKLSNEDAKKRDQLASLFLRWVWPESHGELYFEYGWNDHSANVEDLFISPDHSRAYILGFRKLIPLSRSSEEHIRVNVEVTKLQQSADQIFRPAGSWYEHYQVTHGYTNRGQVMGAGIGPGSNLQSLDISWGKKLNKLGLELERYVHNNDLYYILYRDTQRYDKHWVDLGLGAYGQKAFGKFLLRSQLKFIRSLNYQWDLDPSRQRDRVNGQGQLELIYLF